MANLLTQEFGGLLGIRLPASVWLCRACLPPDCTDVEWLKRGLLGRKSHCPPVGSIETRRSTTGNEVLLAVDPHKHSMTVAVFAVATQVVIEQARQPDNRDGYRELLSLAKRFKQRRWAVEGSQDAGRSMAQRLVADREQVVDVPAKLAARLRVYPQGHGSKTDDHGTASIGLAALKSNRLNTVEVDSVAVTLRLIADRRKELVALRTLAICRLHRLFTDLTPGGAKRFLSAKQAGKLLAKIRPRDDVGRTRKAIAMEHLNEVRSLDRRIKSTEHNPGNGDPFIRHDASSALTCSFVWWLSKKPVR